MSATVALSPVLERGLRVAGAAGTGSGSGPNHAAVVRKRGRVSRRSNRAWPQAWFWVGQKPGPGSQGRPCPARSSARRHSTPQPRGRGRPAAARELVLLRCAACRALPHLLFRYAFSTFLQRSRSCWAVLPPSVTGILLGRFARARVGEELGTRVAAAGGGLAWAVLRGRHPAEVRR